MKHFDPQTGITWNGPFGYRETTAKNPLSDWKVEPLNRSIDEGMIYWRGWQNKLIRIYFYLQQGLNVANQFRYWLMAIISLWVAMKIEWPALSFVFLMLFMIIISIAGFIVLIFLGRYNIKRIGRVTDWLMTYYGSHYGIRNYNIQKNQEEMLMEIRDLLKEIKNKAT